MQARFYHLLLALRCRRPLFLHKSKQRMYPIPIPEPFRMILNIFGGLVFLHACPCLQSSTCRVSSRKYRKKKPSTCIYPNQRIFGFGGGHHQVWEQAQPSCIPKADFPGPTWHKWKEHQLQYRGVFMPGVQQGVYGANPVETNM